MRVANPVSSIPAPASVPLHAASDLRWSLSAEEVARFCFPRGVQHPRSRGRLWVLANQGPLQRRHTYTSCLCAECQSEVRRRRKDDPFMQRIYAGERYTKENVPLSAKEAADAATAAAAAAAEQSGAGAAAASAGVGAAAARPVVPALSGVGNPSSTQLLPSLSAASPLRNPHARVSGTAGGAALGSTLHNARPLGVPAVHPQLGQHSVDQLDFLCRRCAAHARSEAHIFGGPGGRHVLSALEVDQLARRLDEEDLLQAYDRLRRLGPDEEREFLAGLDAEKVARAGLNYTREQLAGLLAPLPRLRDAATGVPTDLIDFYALQRLVNDERRTRIARLGQMYPDAATKGDKSSLQAAAVTMRHDHSQAKRRSALPQQIRAASAGSGGAGGRRAHSSTVGGGAAAAGASGGGGGGSGAGPADHVNGVRWPGESMLTYALLGRKFAPHQSHVLRSRLLHKHTHQVVELGPAANSPSVQLSVALMRNTCLNDRTEGWNTHF